MWTCRTNIMSFKSLSLYPLVCVQHTSVCTAAKSDYRASYNTKTFHLACTIFFFFEQESCLNFKPEFLIT